MFSITEKTTTLGITKTGMTFTKSTTMDEHGIDKTKNEIASLRKNKDYFQNQLEAFRFRWLITIIYLVLSGIPAYGYNVWKSGIKYNFQEAIPYILFGASFGFAIFSCVVFILNIITVSQIRSIDLKL